MKTLLNVSLSRSRWALVSLFALVGGLACGVVEHPHDTQSVGTGDDFGPSSGAGAGTITGGASVGGAMTAASGSGGGGSSGTSDAGSGGGPAPSGVTINLGGVDVPRERAIAFIHIGHSNMAGQARSPFSSNAYHYTETHPHAFMYHAGTPPELSKEPTAGGPGAGPGTALVKEAAMGAADYYFVSLGYGVPKAYCSQFLPGALYYNDLIAAPKAVKGRVTFGGIFIYLGITERHGSADDVNGFSDCINKLVTSIRTDIGEPNLPALMNDYEVDGSGEFIVTGEVAMAIMPQIAKVPSVVSNFALVSADGVGMEDDHHFNFDGQRLWVQRAFQTMKDKGWRFWAP